MAEHHLPTIVFGTGSAARQWYLNSAEKILFFVDNDPAKYTTKFFGHDIKSPEILTSYLNKAKILIASSYVDDIIQQLEEIGFKWQTNIFSVGADQNYYLDPASSIQELFGILYDINADYVIIRHFEEFPQAPSGDIDLLVSDDFYKLIPRLPLVRGNSIELRPENTLIKIDIYSVSGSPGFRYCNMAYIRPRDAYEVLSNKVFFKSIYKVPSPNDLRWLYIYHYCYHKVGSYVSETAASGVQVSKYSRNIRKYFHSTSMSTDKISLHKYLIKTGKSPSASTLRRLVTEPHLLNKYLECYPRQNLMEFPGNYMTEGLIIYFVRERAKEINCLHLIRNYIETTYLDLVGEIKISRGSKIRDVVRGGNWFDPYGKFTNGFPYLLLVCNDPRRKTLNDSQKAMNIPFVRYQSYFIKEQLRAYLANNYPAEPELNLVHSTDDTFEVEETFHCLSSTEQYKFLDMLSKYFKD